MPSARFSAVTRGLVSALAVASAPMAAGQSAATTTTILPGAILVQVTDTAINPLAAEVTLPALALGVRLSEEGAVLLMNVPAGVYVVQVRYFGHRAQSRLIRVTADTVRLDFVLTPTGGDGADRNEREAIAAARLLDFLGRSALIPSGSFLTKKEIKRRRARTMTALLARVRDVEVERRGSGSPIVRSADTKGPACPEGMLAFVDAVQLGTGPRPVMASAETTESDTGSDSGWRLTTGRRDRAPGVVRWIGTAGRGRVAVNAPTIERPSQPKGSTWSAEIDRVPLSSVVAVEVYPSFAGVPQEFRVPGAECGVVLVWTDGR